jgi:hypothetical protein
VALNNPVASDTSILDDAPELVDLAILLPNTAFQKHDGV